MRPAAEREARDRFLAANYNGSHGLPRGTVETWSCKHCQHTRTTNKGIYNNITGARFNAYFVRAWAHIFTTHPDVARHITWADWEEAGGEADRLKTPTTPRPGHLAQPVEYSPIEPMDWPAEGNANHHTAIHDLPSPKMPEPFLSLARGGQFHPRARARFSRAHVFVA
ncbi:hypothetical protein RQP46_010434 [Phenoliferia psychrophenolica]